jgi:hypothetical protein
MPLLRRRIDFKEIQKTVLRDVDVQEGTMNFFLGSFLFYLLTHALWIKLFPKYDVLTSWQWWVFYVPTALILFNLIRYLIT